MQTHRVIRTLSILAAFTGGLALACESGSTSNSAHCFNNDGDATCAELYAGERPFCLGPGESCGVAPGADGCVAELPGTECYSPCGGEALFADDASCLPDGADTDETGGESEPGDGDGDGDSTGDGDGEPEPVGPYCGDGEVAAEEQCDDGNDVNDDECSNACTIASCGDGIVQAQLGETCDDGDTHGADGCAANCVLPGTIVWERYSDLPDAWGLGVAVAPSGNIGVLARSTELGDRVLGLAPTGETSWNVAGPDTATAIAAGSSGQFMVGGEVAGKGQIWRIDADGSTKWTAEVPAPTSTILDVAVTSGGSVVSVGSAYGQGMWMRHQVTGAQTEFKAVSGTGTLDAVATRSTGHWMLRDTPRQLVRHDGSAVKWSSDEVSGFATSFADITVDEFDNAYFLGNVAGALDSFAVTKFDPDGQILWTSHHDHADTIEAALAVAPLPLGGVVVAGFTHFDSETGESDALLSWYGPDGTLMGDYVFDGADDVDIDAFADVAVGPDGSVVAVGMHSAGGDNRLWVVKVAI